MKTKVSDHYMKNQLEVLPLESLMDCLPQNLIYYKDSGCWSIRDESTLEELDVEYHGGLKDLVLRYLLNQEYSEARAYDIVCALADFKFYPNDTTF